MGYKPGSKRSSTPNTTQAKYPAGNGKGCDTHGPKTKSQIGSVSTNTQKGLSGGDCNEKPLGNNR